MNIVAQLLKEANSITYDHPVMKKVEAFEKRHCGFFPGCIGTFNNEENIEEKEIMILGNDYGPVDKEQKNGKIKKNTTWENLKKLLEGIDETEKNEIIKKCFFTNAFMGIRIGEKTIGECPLSDNPEFVKQCQDFFYRQLEFLPKLKLVIILGKEAPKLLYLAKHNEKGNIFHQLIIWTKPFREIDKYSSQQIISAIHHPITNKKLIFTIITHPSDTRNQKLRRYKNSAGIAFKEKKAEIEILKEAMRQARLLKSL
jgi:uracil-DNA glycosylase